MNCGINVRDSRARHCNESWTMIVDDGGARARVLRVQRFLVEEALASLDQGNLPLNVGF